MNLNKNTSVVVTILLVVVIAVVVGVLVWQFKPTEEALSKSQKVVKDYGEAMTTRKKGKVIPYTTGELEEEVQGWLPVFGTSNPHPDGIKVLSSKKIGDNKFKIKARLFEAYTGEGRIGYRDNIYTVKKERGKYLISTVEPGEYISISEEADAIQKASVTSPNGGEQWKTGEIYNITWNSSELERVIVWLRDYSKGINFKACRLTDTYVEADKGEFTWKVDSKNCKLTSEVGDKFKIAVTEPEGMTKPHLSDTSDDFFSIKSQEGRSITVTSPNGGEEWDRQKDYSITWTSSFSSEEKVKLIVTHNDVPSTLITQTSDTGSYNWSIDETQIGTGSTLPAGSNYKIKICSLKDNSVCGTSDDYFKVVE